MILCTVSIRIDVIDGLGPHLSYQPQYCRASRPVSSKTSAASLPSFQTLLPKSSWLPALASQSSPKSGLSVR